MATYQTTPHHTPADHTAMATTATTTSTNGALVTALQKKLGIQWKCANQLLERAATNCDIINDEENLGIIPPDREDEVLEEACELFAELSANEQEAMRVKDASEPRPEPEWKMRAVRAAEKRQADAEAMAAAAAASEVVREKLREQGAEHVDSTQVISIRKLPEQSAATSSTDNNKPKVTVRRHTCVCAIL